MSEMIVAIVGATTLGISTLAAIMEFFIYARLSRLCSVEIGKVAFSSDREDYVYVEVAVKNESRTRAEISRIEYRVPYVDDGSIENRLIMNKVIDWQYIGGRPRQVWAPNQVYDLVLMIPWRKQQLSAPLYMRVTLVESLDVRGPFRALFRLVTLRHRQPRIDNMVKLVCRPGTTAETVSRPGEKEDKGARKIA